MGSRGVLLGCPVAIPLFYRATFMAPGGERELIWGLTTGNKYKISLTQVLGKIKNILVSLFIRRPAKKLMIAICETASNMSGSKPTSN